MSDENKPALKVASDYPSFFNKGQVALLDKAIDWSKSGTSPRFVVEGPAGTGKTTVLKQFMQHCYGKDAFRIAAPTHKAARVAGKAVGKEGYTIHKVLGLRPNLNLDNFNPRNVQFGAAGKNHFPDIKMLAVDEAGMLNKHVIEMLDTEAAKHGTKILYMGDPYQLPPVKEQYSSVFNIHRDFKGSLTEIMRQGDDNPLSDLLLKIRNSVKRGSFDYIKDINGAFNMRDNGKGFAHVDQHTYEDYVMSAFSNKIFYENIDFCKMVAYTNKNVAQWNVFVRNRLFTDSGDKPLIIHDLMTCYNTIVDEFKDAKIINSEDYIIKDYHNYRNKYDLEGWIVQLQEVSTGRITPPMFIVDHTNKAVFQAYAMRLKELIVAASNKLVAGSVRGKLWGEYYKFKDDNLCMIDVYDPKTADIFEPKATDKVMVGKDLDYGYSLTAHKSQGSTYGHVFVNLKNIIYGDRSDGQMVNNVNMINRLFYVAASRPKDTLTVLF